jgi:hypothetical protein
VKALGCSRRPAFDQGFDDQRSTELRGSGPRDGCPSRNSRIAVVSQTSVAATVYHTAVAVLRRRYGLEGTHPIGTRNTGVQRHPDGKGVRCRAAAGDVRFVMSASLQSSVCVTSSVS